MAGKQNKKIDALEQIAAQAAYDNACARASLFIACSIENSVTVVGVADTIAMLKTHVEHLQEFE